MIESTKCFKEGQAVIKYISLAKFKKRKSFNNARKLWLDCQRYDLMNLFPEDAKKIFVKGIQRQHDKETEKESEKFINAHLDIYIYREMENATKEGKTKEEKGAELSMVIKEITGYKPTYKAIYHRYSKIRKIHRS